MVSYSKAQAGQAAMILNSAESLLGAVQMNMLELHTWNGTDKDFDKPDRFVLDLDPDPALPWKAMLEATQLTLTLLDELGLKVFLKTSGGKGMHLVVPLTRRAGWDEVKDFSHAIVQYLARLFPERLSAVSGPKNRVGRIFIDYLRNGKGATTVSAYSCAPASLPVSVPIWREVTSAQGRQPMAHRQPGRASGGSRRPLGGSCQDTPVDHRSHAQADGAELMAVLLDLLQWPAMLLTVLAAWCIGSRQPRRRRAGFAASSAATCCG